MGHLLRLTSAVSLGALPAVAYVAPRAARSDAVRRRVPPLAAAGRRDHVALTFDDGPDPAWTPAVLERLDALGVKATFFMLGEMVEQSPGTAARVAAAGHQVGVHGWDHRAHGLRRSPWDVRAELQRARSVIENGAGVPVSLYRPPFGTANLGSLWAARSLGLRCALWGATGYDFTEGATWRSVMDHLDPYLDGGVTVLLHDSDRRGHPGSTQATVDVLVPLVARLRGLGLEVGSLADHFGARR